jgi:hypothetical protein
MHMAWAEGVEASGRLVAKHFTVTLANGITITAESAVITKSASGPDRWELSGNVNAIVPK